MASLETWIGLRYLRAKKRNGFMSFITMVSIAGIALGVMALIVVLSVMNGFQKEIRGQLLNVAPHAEIGYYDNGGGENWQNLRQFVKGKKEVLASAPYVSDQALLANAGEVRGVQIRGILPDEEKNVVDYGDNMPSGSFNDLKPGGFDIILGEGLAEALGTEKGGKVTVITPEGNVTPAGVVPRLKQFNVVGIVKTGVYEVDNSLALTHIKDAQVLYRLGENVGGLRHPRTYGDVGLGGDNRLDGQAAVDADVGFALQDGILHGLVAADDFVQRTECDDDVRRIGRQHDDALRVGGGCKGDEGGENGVFGFHGISFEGFRRP